MIHEAAEPKGRLRYEYATGAVGTTTWVLVGAMPNIGAVSTCEIYDSGTFAMEMKLDTVAGTSASTYCNMYIMPGGNGRIPLRLDGGSSTALNLYIRAVGTGASAATGQFIINFW